jgi:putative ABC transport system permease protein
MMSVRWIDALFQDLRYACRVLTRAPAFAAVVILTLALGIGANTAIVSVAYAVLVKPLPYAHPDEIHSVEVVIPERREQIPSLAPTVQTYALWRGTQTVFTDISAMTPWEASITGDGEPERLGGARVSANFFSFLGVPIARGRAPTADEEQPGADRVVVISDALWRMRYASDPSVIGRTVVINGESYTVIGVAAPSLLVPTGTQLHALLPFAPRIDIWKPIAPTPRELRNESWDHGVLVRLPNGASQEQGRQQLEAALNERLRALMPGVRTQVVVQLLPIRDIYTGKVRLRLLLVLAASALLLLTACASTANVFLARVASRSSEYATRIALGAGRARILVQAVTESVLLALAGGAVGALVATAGTRALAAAGPDDVRLLTGTQTNVPLLLAAVTVSLITGVVCGIVPAWQAGRRNAGAELQDAGRAVVGGRRAVRARQALVGVEIALATMLLASAALLLHSFVKVMGADRGYEVDRVLAVDLSVFGQRYAAPGARVTFYRGLVEDVRRLPGVVAAGAISNLPAAAIAEGASRTIFHPTDTDFQSLVLSRPVAMIRSVTSGYFAASGTPLRAGRFFADDDRRLVAVISESLASRLWPGDVPSAIVGRSLRQGGVNDPLIEVTGVVADVHPGGFDRDPPPAIYRPYGQWPSGPMTLVLRTAQEPASLGAAVRAEIRKLDPDLPLMAVRTMREIVSSSVAPRRFQMTLTLLFAVVALFLGAVGVYGVVSYAVASRTRDIGLRMALGALRADVMRWIFVNGMQPVLIGLAVGLLGAIAAARALRSMLFGIAPADPVSLGIVAAVLLVASGLACYLPARRAAALDPMVALRHE